MAKAPVNQKRLLSVKAIGRLILGLIALVCLVVLSLPLWLGWALKTFSPDELVQFETYETDGYGRFRLKEVNIILPEASISVHELTAPSPLNWLSNSILGRTSSIFVTMTDVEVELVENDENTQTPNSLLKDLPSTVQFIETILLKTDKWIPRANIQNATVTRGKTSAVLNSIDWNNRVLMSEGVINEYPDFPFQLSLNLQTNGQTLDLKIPAADFDLKSNLRAQDSKWIASSVLIFRENTALIEATFGKETWSPDTASWNLNDWKLNPNTLGLNSAYSELTFNLQGGWDESAIANTLDGHLSTGPERTDEYFPPVDFQSEISGNTQALSMTRFSLEAPGINASIDEPVSYNLQQMEVAGDLRFDIDFDLGILKRDDLEGRMTGLLEISTDKGNPVGQFVLTGTGLKIQSFDFDNLDLDAELDWPHLNLRSVSAELSTGSTFQAAGLVDLQSRSIVTAKISGTLEQSTLIALLPENVSLQSTSFEAEASGPFNSIDHAGALQVDSIETAVFKPLSADAAWRGKHLNLESLEVTARSEENQLKIVAAGNLDSSQMRWQISQFEHNSENRLLGKLTTPSTLQIDKEDTLKVTLADFLLKGDEDTISVNAQLQYPTSGKLELNAENIDTKNWLDPWIKNPPTPINVNSLQARGDWNQGPLNFDTTIDAQASLTGRLVIATGRLISEGSNIQLENVVISDTQAPWISVNGQAPISIHLAEDEILQLHRDDSFSLKFSTSESQNWIDWLSEISPFQLETFSSDVELGGSISDLQGNYKIQAVTQEGQGDHGMPSTLISTHGSIKNNLLTVSSLDVKVAEEQFEITGSVNLPKALFDKIDNPAATIPWEETGFQLNIPPSKLTPMRYFAPQLLSTGGEIEADLKGSITDGISGFFRVNGMNTRAVFPFGSLRELSADLEFKNSEATLNNISGFIGREPVAITGSLDYRNWEQPRYHFTIKGNDLPLLRKPGLLLRSDLNLEIDKATEEPTAITGEINLKSGLYLLNRSNILAGDSGGGRTAATRPPYFSVDIQPLSDWSLDVAVKGDQFMRVKTPAADGVLSLDMKLQGKLREPFAIGRVEFDKGNIYFPFSSFNIDYGIAELPLSNPYTPVIEIIGSSRRFGYDIGVEITGTAYEPQVHFTSSPPLSSEAIMLMVMAGENPDGAINYSYTQRASKLGAFISKGLFASDSNSNFVNRLNLNSGENLSEQGKETMEIEFLLNDRFQLIGEYDEYDFWNAGIRWNIVRRHARDTGKETPEE